MHTFKGAIRGALQAYIRDKRPDTVRLGKFKIRAIRSQGHYVRVPIRVGSCADSPMHDDGLHFHTDFIRVYGWKRIDKH